MLNHSHVIHKLTEAQKLRLLTDIHSTEDPGLNALGVPRVCLRTAFDGRNSRYPSPSFLACSWDEELVGEVTEALCREALAQGVRHVVLPSPKPKLTPYGDALSEDPYLSARLSAAALTGALRTGASVSPEGYGFTPSERGDAEGDQAIRFARTFLHIPFRALSRVGGYAGFVTEGECPASGIARETPRLFCHATTPVETVKALSEGQICLKGSEEGLKLALANYRRLQNAVEHGKATTGDLLAACSAGEAFSPEKIDAALDRLLDFAFVCEGVKATEAPSSADAHALARYASLSSVVLLENRCNGKSKRPLLPLGTPRRVGIIGAVAMEDPEALSGMTSVLAAKGHTLTGTALGYGCDGRRDDALTQEALELAARSDTVLLFVGTTPETEDSMEREGIRTLPPPQRALCDRMSCLDKEIIVVVSSRVSLDMAFVTRAVHPFGAVLWADVTPPAALSVLADILVGGQSPSGRLPVTLCAHHREAEACHRDRKVGSFVGYRYYDTVGCGALYPFGHGLSYTTFRYSNLREENGNVIFTVKNTGKVAGTETAQVYMGMEGSAILRPRKELVGYARVTLVPGETTTVILPIGVHLEPDDPLEIEKGRYTVYVGASVEDIRLTRTRLGGSVVLPSDGEDPADYLPTLSNIQTQRYVMEAERKPMKSSLRNLISGIVALCLAGGLKIYEIVTLADSVFLNVIAVILAVGSAVFFGMEFVDRRKRAALEQEALDADTAALFSDADSVPVLSVDTLFEDKLYIPEEREEAEEAEEYDHLADVDKTLTLTRAAAELSAYAAASGLLLKEDMVHALLAALASSRLLIVKDMSDEMLSALVTTLGGYFTSVTSTESARGVTSEAGLLFDEREDGSLAPRGLFSVMESAARERGRIHVAALTEVDPATAATYLVPFARYAKAPTSGVTISVKTPDGDEGLHRIPENLWLVLSLKSGASPCELPAFLSEAATHHAWDGEITAPAPGGPSVVTHFGYGQMGYLCDGLLSRFAVEEDTWKRIDRLEAYAARFSDFRIGNKLWRNLEVYMAVLMDLSHPEASARDAALAALLMPSLTSALSGKLPREERSLTETLDHLLGEGSVPLCQKAVKESGADLR